MWHCFRRAALSLSAGAAEAARPAVAVEEGAILKASGFPPGSAGIKSGCVRPVVRVSGNSAFVFFTFRNSSACIRYAFNGSIGLRLVGGKWKQVFVGSDVPSCDLGLPADLTPCRPIRALAGVTAYGYERAVLSGDIGTACSLLSAEGVAALRKHLGQPGGVGCPTVMRVWAGEPNHGLPDNIAKLRVLSEQVAPPTAVIVIGGLHGLSPVTLRLHQQSDRWVVDASKT